MVVLTSRKTITSPKVRTRELHQGEYRNSLERARCDAPRTNVTRNATPWELESIVMRDNARHNEAAPSMISKALRVLNVHTARTPVTGARLSWQGGAGTPPVFLARASCRVDTVYKENDKRLSVKNWR